VRYSLLQADTEHLHSSLLNVIAIKHFNKCLRFQRVKHFCATITKLSFFKEIMCLKCIFYFTVSERDLMLNYTYTCTKPTFVYFATEIA
jgi:hypothetical protein